MVKARRPSLLTSAPSTGPSHEQELALRRQIVREREQRAATRALQALRERDGASDGDEQR
jgi:hypothetical protein